MGSNIKMPSLSIVDLYLLKDLRESGSSEPSDTRPSRSSHEVQRSSDLLLCRYSWTVWPLSSRPGIAYDYQVLSYFNNQCVCTISWDRETSSENIAIFVPPQEWYCMCIPATRVYYQLPHTCMEFDSVLMQLLSLEYTLTPGSLFGWDMKVHSGWQMFSYSVCHNPSLFTALVRSLDDRIWVGLHALQTHYHAQYARRCMFSGKYLRDCGLHCRTFAVFI